MPSAPSTSLVMSIWPRNSSGVADRPALYSGYFSSRKVCRETSNAAAMWLGCSSRSRLISIAVNPYTALVVSPPWVLKFSAGSA